MGGGSSKQEKEKHQNLEKRFVAAFEPIKGFCDLMQIKRENVKLIYRMFEYVNMSQNNKISLHEYITQLKLKERHFAVESFFALDTSGDEKLQFYEFFVGLYYYLTLSEREVLHFAFDLFDLAGNEYITHDDFKHLIHKVHGHKSDHKTQKLLHDMYKKLDHGKKDGQLSYNEFSRLDKLYPSLLFDAFTLQKHLQDEVLGKPYWAMETEKRKKSRYSTTNLIKFYHELTNHGDKLNRVHNRVESKKVFYVRAVVVHPENDGASSPITEVNVHEAASFESKVVAKFKLDYYVDLVEMHSCEDGSIWYRLDPDRQSNTGWLHEKFVDIETKRPEP